MSSFGFAGNARTAWYASVAGRDLTFMDGVHWSLAEVAMHRTYLSALAALASLSLLAPTAHAQPQAAFTNGYLEWGLRTDVPRVPYDGAPFSEKYIAANYSAMPLMIGADPQRLWYMYHWDRVDRAMRNGRPLAPGDGVPPPPPNPPRRTGFFGLFSGH